MTLILWRENPLTADFKVSFFSFWAVCLPCHFLTVAFNQRTAKGASGKGPRQKTSKIVKKCQKYFRHFSTIFARGKKTQKSSKSVKNIFDTFRQISRGTSFPAPFGGLWFKYSKSGTEKTGRPGDHTMKFKGGSTVLHLVCFAMRHKSSAYHPKKSTRIMFDDRYPIWAFSNQFWKITRYICIVYTHEIFPA